jgi:hypothetical protein
MAFTRSGFSCVKKWEVPGTTASSALGNASYMSTAWVSVIRSSSENITSERCLTLWLWAKTNSRNLIGNAKLARGEVLLTVRVPRVRVVLSHFDDWHTVLDRSLEVPLLPGETYEQWSPRVDAIRDAWDEREEPYRDLPIEPGPASPR